MPDSSEGVDKEGLYAEYTSAKPNAERFIQQARTQIKSLLKQSEIRLGFPVQGRVKKYESLVDKIERLDHTFDSILDIQDFVGLRIVPLFRKDVESISSILRDTFRIRREYDTSERLEYDQFGYSSVHLVIGLPEDWTSSDSPIPSMKGLGDIKAEIQVRTLPQHLWARSSEVLQYKQKSDVPEEMRRSIHRLSALLETVDIELERVRSRRSDYLETINEEVPNNENLNVDILKNALDNNLPNANKEEDEPYSRLLNELKLNGINKLNDLLELIEENKDYALVKEEKQIEKHMKKREKGEMIYVDPEKLDMGVFYTHVGLVRAMMQNEIGDDYDRVPFPTPDPHPPE